MMRQWSHQAPLPSTAAPNAGFTLIELVAVLLLLGILAAVAVPVFFNLEDYRARAAYDELAGAARYAQKLAVASGCETQMVISGGAYALQQRSGGCASGAFTTISGHPVTSGSFTGVTLAATPSSFIFDAMGRSSGSVVIDVGGRHFRVSAETGYVDAP